MSANILMEYFIVEQANKQEFEEKINACLEEGWKLQGGVNTSTEHDHTGQIRYWYHQAITKP